MKGPVISMNSRLAFVVFGGFYLSVLVASYLLALSYPFFAPYGLFLVPALANFCMGYFIGDVYTVVKIIIAVFSLQTCILFALLYSTVSDFFILVATISSHFTLQVPFGIAVSYLGMGVREESSNIIAVCTYLTKKIKQIIESVASKIRRQ